MFSLNLLLVLNAESQICIRQRAGIDTLSSETALTQIGQLLVNEGTTDEGAESAGAL